MFGADEGLRNNESKELYARDKFLICFSQSLLYHLGAG
jgi:hypothetical protein